MIVGRDMLKKHKKMRMREMKMKDEATELPKCGFNVPDAEYKYMQTLYCPQKIFNTQSGHKRQKHCFFVFF